MKPQRMRKLVVTLDRSVLAALHPEVDREDKVAARIVVHEEVVSPHFHPMAADNAVEVASVVQVDVADLAVDLKVADSAKLLNNLCGIR